MFWRIPVDFRIVCVLSICTVTVAFFIFGPVADRVSKDAGRVSAAPVASLDNIPLSFEPNVGQASEEVRFLCRGNGYTFFLTGRDALLRLRRDSGSDTMVAMRLENSNASPVVAGENQQPGKSNYFVGNDPENWRTDIPQFSRVRYAEVYPGIDQVFYGNGRQLEYDFVVSAGADPTQISIRFDGIEQVELDTAGDLVLSVDGGTIRQFSPVLYQEIDGARLPVEGSYAIREDRTIGFDVGKYDRSQPLVIDPVLVYSTYLGGNAADAGRAIAIDVERNVYVTGSTAATNFPVVNPIQPANGGGGRSDIFVTKINPAGTAIVYSTYIGGSAGELGHGIDVDAAGNAYVTGVTGGVTGANNFPTTPGAFDRTFNSPDEAVLLKISSAGNTLVYSTYTTAANALEVKVDKTTGEAYIAGNAGGVLVTTPGAFRETCQPSPCSGNGFISKFNSTGSALVYSTYIGPGIANDLAIDSNGNAYVTGVTTSSVFPVTPGAAQPTCRGCEFFRSDAFVMKMNSTGSALVYSTYLGGSQGDVGTSIALDPAFNAYVTGRTESSNSVTVPFPTTPGAYQTTSPGIPDGFVTKVNTTGSEFLYSTFLGGNVTDEAFGIAVDRAGKAHVTGQTRSNTFPKVAAIQDVCTVNGPCAFITSLNAAGSDVVFSTYFGQGAGHEIAADGAGSVYVTGETYEGLSNLPLANPIQPAPGGGSSVQDGFVAKIFIQALKPTLFDLDGDGKSDFSIFRPATGEWWYQQSGDGAVMVRQFGTSTDRIVPGDYTGDGRTDIAVWRPATGTWFILRSENGSFFAFAFGQSGDIPVPADFDGDSKSDAAVFRASNSTWYILRSSDGQVSVSTFGAASDHPVAADYDGDGRSDVGVFRPATGEWWIQRSTSGLLVVTFGTSGDKPVPGDYTGDGKADIAVWRPSTGEWYVLRSENLSYFSLPFGTNGDVPSPADYDGDGRYDPTVFRPSTGTWYSNRTAGGILIRQFGTAGDRPVPNAFVQ